MQRGHSRKFKDRVLDSQLALSLIGREAPNDLIVNGEDITRLGNLCDAAFIRKLSISFNPIKSLDGVDQMPQLRQLIAYSCEIDDIHCLKELTKIESIMLQQNRIPAIIDAFRSLTKLQELRLDRNKITKIENLKSCTVLRKLDLSANMIESLDGLNGLQKLEELNVSRNAIKSLLPLKSLPSIKEIDISSNQLKNLDGLRQMPTLEYINAAHNNISNLNIAAPPQSSNKRRAEQSSKRPSMRGSGSNTSMTSASSSTSKASSSAASASTSNGGANAGAAFSTLGDLPDLCLTDVYLAGNRIRSIAGFEVYSKCADTIDLSNNNIETVAEMQSVLSQFKALSELRVFGNACCNDTTAMAHFNSILVSACPLLKAIDGDAIVAHHHHQTGGHDDDDTVAQTASKKIAKRSSSEVRLVGTSANSSNGGKALSVQTGADGVTAGPDTGSSIDSTNSQFHTWEDHSSSLHVPADIKEVDDDKSENDEEEEEEELSEGEKENLRQVAAVAEAAKAAEESAVPRPILMPMVTEEEILMKEESIRNIIQQSKAVLAETVFIHMEKEVDAALAEEAEAMDKQHVEEAAAVLSARTASSSSSSSRKSHNSGNIGNTDGTTTAAVTNGDDDGNDRVPTTTATRIIKKARSRAAATASAAGLYGNDAKGLSTILESPLSKQMADAGSSTTDSGGFEGFLVAATANDDRAAGARNTLVERVRFAVENTPTGATTGATAGANDGAAAGATTTRSSVPSAAERALSAAFAADEAAAEEQRQKEKMRESYESTWDDTNLSLDAWNAKNAKQAKAGTAAKKNMQPDRSESRIADSSSTSSLAEEPSKRNGKPPNQSRAGTGPRGVGALTGQSINALGSGLTRYGTKTNNQILAGATSFAAGGSNDTAGDTNPAISMTSSASLRHFADAGLNTSSSSSSSSSITTYDATTGSIVGSNSAGKLGSAPPDTAAAGVAAAYAEHIENALNLNLRIKKQNHLTFMNTDIHSNLEPHNPLMPHSGGDVAAETSDASDVTHAVYEAAQAAAAAAAGAAGTDNEHSSMPHRRRVDRFGAVMSSNGGQVGYDPRTLRSIGRRGSVPSSLPTAGDDTPSDTGADTGAIEQLWSPPKALGSEVPPMIRSHSAPRPDTDFSTFDGASSSTAGIATGAAATATTEVSGRATGDDAAVDDCAEDDLSSQAELRLEIQSTGDLGPPTHTRPRSKGAYASSSTTRAPTTKSSSAAPTPTAAADALLSLHLSNPSPRMPPPPSPSVASVVRLQDYGFTTPRDQPITTTTNTTASAGNAANIGAMPVTPPQPILSHLKIPATSAAAVAREAGDTVGVLGDGHMSSDGSLLLAGSVGSLSADSIDRRQKTKLNFRIPEQARKVINAEPSLDKDANASPVRSPLLEARNAVTGSVFDGADSGAVDGGGSAAVADLVHVSDLEREIMRSTGVSPRPPSGPFSRPLSGTGAVSSFGGVIHAAPVRTDK